MCPVIGRDRKSLIYSVGMNHFCWRFLWVHWLLWGPECCVTNRVWQIVAARNHDCYD
jgi:hypothetical protein